MHANHALELRDQRLQSNGRELRTRNLAALLLQIRRQNASRQSSASAFAKTSAPRCHLHQLLVIREQSGRGASVELVNFLLNVG